MNGGGSNDVIKEGNQRQKHRKEGNWKKMQRQGTKADNVSDNGTKEEKKDIGRDRQKTQTRNMIYHINLQ